MAKQKAKSRKRRVRGIPPLPHDAPNKAPVTLEPVIAVLTRIIKSGRDVNATDKNLLADLVDKLKA